MIGGSYFVGWMSKILVFFFDELDVFYFVGLVSNFFINLRYLIGLLFFIWFLFFLSGIKGESNIIIIEVLIDYLLNYLLYDDSKNEMKKNEFWIELFIVVYGFILLD